MKDGRAAIFSKYTGIEHAHIAQHFGGNQYHDLVRSAGFVYLDGDLFKTYGGSISLGIKSHPEDAADLNAFLRNDHFKMIWWGNTHGFGEGNVLFSDPNGVRPGERADLEMMLKNNIITER